MAQEQGLAVSSIASQVPSTNISFNPPTLMDALNAHLDELMRMMGKEHSQRLATEETLRQTQACLNAMAGQQNPAPGPPCYYLITITGTVLWNPCQTGTVSAYTQDFNQHVRTVAWADTPLMSLYQHGLIQLAVVMSNLEFDFLRSMQAMALKEEGPTQPTLQQRAHWVLRNLCFRCCQAGHISRGCLNGGRKPQ
ncbi:uncharacterized protein VP01_3841g1, partial [Puccinia sorghi]